MADEVLATINKELEKGHAIALATVFSREGSAPRGAGSRLAANASGLLAGTVGGGLLEARVIEGCARACSDGKATILEFDMTGDIAASADLICGGKIRALIEPFAPDSSSMDLFRLITDSLQQSRVIVVRPCLPEMAGGQFSGMTAGVLAPHCLSVWRTWPVPGKRMSLCWRRKAQSISARDFLRARECLLPAAAMFHINLPPWPYWPVLKLLSWMTGRNLRCQTVFRSAKSGRFRLSRAVSMARNWGNGIILSF